MPRYNNLIIIIIINYKIKIIAIRKYKEPQFSLDFHSFKFSERISTVKWRGGVRKKKRNKGYYRVARDRWKRSTHFSVGRRGGHGRITINKGLGVAVYSGTPRGDRRAQTRTDHIREVGFMRTYVCTGHMEGGRTRGSRLQERLSSFYLELRGRSLAPGKPGVLERASPGRRLGSIPTPSVSLAPSLRCRGKSPRRWRPGRGKRATEEEERVGREGEIQPSGPSFLPSSILPQPPAILCSLRFLDSVVRSFILTSSCDFFILATASTSISLNCCNVSICD